MKKLEDYIHEAIKSNCDEFDKKMLRIYHELAAERAMLGPPDRIINIYAVFRPDLECKVTS